MPLLMLFRFKGLQVHAAESPEEVAAVLSAILTAVLSPTTQSNDLENLRTKLTERPKTYTRRNGGLILVAIQGPPDLSPALLGDISNFIRNVPTLPDYCPDWKTQPSQILGVITLRSSCIRAEDAVILHGSTGPRGDIERFTFMVSNGKPGKEHAQFVAGVGYALFETAIRAARGLGYAQVHLPRNMALGYDHMRALRLNRGYAQGWGWTLNLK